MGCDPVEALLEVSLSNGVAPRTNLGHGPISRPHQGGPVVRLGQFPSVPLHSGKEPQGTLRHAPLRSFLAPLPVSPLNALDPPPPIAPCQHMVEAPFRTPQPSQELTTDWISLT